MNKKILIASILVAFVVGTIFSSVSLNLFPDLIQVYAGQTLTNDDVAKSLVVRIMTDGDKKEKTFNSFSKIGFIRSSGIEFLLESIPSKDKIPFYESVEKSLAITNPPLMNVNIDVFSGDGTIIETLNYNRCTVTSYFVHVNDSKGKFSFLKDGDSNMEIRDVARFECAGFKITVLKT